MLNTDAMLERQTRRTLVVAVVFGLGGLLWSATAPLEGAVAATGTLVLENNVKKIQHPTGGVVGKLFVQEGQHVAAGDQILKLDETATRANLGVVMNDLMANMARRARLLAERDGLFTPEFPRELLEQSNLDSDVATAIDSERKVFESRLISRNGQKSQLVERVGQLRREIEGLELQKRSTDIQLDVARKELADLRGLEGKRLVPRNRITALEREVARSDGVLGDTIAHIAQTEGKISETQLQIDQVDRDKLTDVNKDLREAETKISELRERRISAEDQLRRVEIRSPITGTVQQLIVHTIGGVVAPTDQIMIIVPDTDQLVIEARVNPQDRDQVKMNQASRVRFPSFNQRTTPELQATVFRISGDVIRDTQSGQSYYSVGVRVGEDELSKLRDAKLSAGMPAETFFKTSERTLMSYLLKPLTDHWQRSFSGR